MLKGLSIAVDTLQHVIDRLTNNSSLDQDQKTVSTEFLKRGRMLALSALHLVHIGNIRDGLALHRSLFERTIYLHCLIKNNQFSQFVQWSMAKQYREADVIFGDQSVRALLTQDQLQTLKQRQAERRANFGGDPPEKPSYYWKKPKDSIMIDDLVKNSPIPVHYALYWRETGSAATHPTHDDSVQVDEDAPVLANEVLKDLTVLIATAALLLSPQDQTDVVTNLIESIKDLRPNNDDSTA